MRQLKCAFLLVCAFLAMPASAVISIGVVGTASSAASPTTLTTSSVNSAASGSGFVVTLVTVTGTTTTVTPTVTDAFGNTYTKASQLAFISGGSSYLVDRFYINPGASGYVGGGTAHTATITINRGGANAAVGLWATLTEMLGAASGTGNFYGAAASHTYPFSSTGPYASASLIVTAPSGGVALLSTLSCGSPTTGTGSDSTGFTAQLTSALAVAGSVGGAIGTRIVTSSATYSPSWTWSSGSVEAFDTVDSFFGSSGGGGGVQPRMMLMGIGASIQSAPLYFHDIDPFDFRRRAANDSDFSHKRTA